MNIERRQFIAGSGLACIGALTAGLAGCASAPKQEDAPKTDAAATQAGIDTSAIAETIDCDICIVGGGMSGLAAACQAGENGDSVVVVEAAGECGGAGNGVEGLFAVESPLQAKLGIEVDRTAVLTEEVVGTNYTNSGLHWKDMIDNSGDNIQWLIDQGVEFSGQVDGYMPAGKFMGYHWFKNGHAREGYVPQMVARAQDLGVDVRTLTTAKELIVDNNKVVGLYAENSNHEVIQVNAKAVILAAGGFIGNTDLLAKQMFIAEGEMAQACLDTAATLNRMGAGVEMALAVGAKEYLGTCIEGWYQPATLPIGDAAMTWTVMFNDVIARDVLVNSGLCGTPTSLWVQEDALRFVNESESLTEPERTFTTRKFYKDHYQVFDQKTVDALFQDEKIRAAFEQMMTEYPESVMKADSIADLASCVGLEPSALEETVTTYNAFCSNGKDIDFGKPAEFLVPIDTAPYYIYKCEICGDATLGGICVDRNFRALDEQKNPIEGLYMAGVDACMLYNCVYPIAIGGTACANSVNSGRTAANHAHATLSV